MPEMLKECKHAPPATSVLYKCTAAKESVLYSDELTEDDELKSLRKQGVMVEAQTFYEARRLGAIELYLAPEHVRVTHDSTNAEQWSEVG